MFARTARLTLRPGWPEDAGALAAAIGHRDVARMTSRIPWPYAAADAEAFLALAVGPRHPSCLVFAHDRADMFAHGAPDGAPALVGGIALYDAEGAHELGYWLTPAAWGRGYATEMAAAMLAHARHALALRHVQAGHFADNPASGRVLRKLGFVHTGDTAYPSLARGREAPAHRFLLDLAATPAPMSA